jgi:subtilisin family serine protease
MKTKTLPVRFILFGILCTLISTGINAQDTERNKKINEQISRISREKKANKQLRCNGLEQIGSNSNKSHESLTKNWITKGNAVQIIANSSDDVNGLVQELTLLGTLNIKTYGKTVTGYIPMDSVSKLENCKHLRSAAPSVRPRLNSGGVNSEGDLAMFSQNLRKRYNIDGKGIKIGILSNSYNVQGLAESEVLKGELPGPGNPFGYTKPVQILSEIEKPTEFAVDEGRAMAQIIHDVAPGAELFFYSAFNGYFDFADGIKALAAKGCNVIVDDVFYFGDPMFQDGLLSQAVDEVSKKGVMYFNACGNSGNKGFEAKYKEFSVTDSQGITNNYFDFGNQDEKQTITISGTEETGFPGSIFLILHWDAPSSFAGSTNPVPEIDLDIFLVDTLTGEVVASGIEDNVKLLNSFETLSFTNTANENRDYEIIIQNSLEKKPTRIKYVDSDNSVIFKEEVAGINAPTIYGLSNTKSAMSIGANQATITPAFGEEYALENFSSIGGGFGIIFDKNGKLIPEQFRNKPDLVGPDGVATSVPRFESFAGTSAAAPHVAAVAALIKQSNMSLTREQIFEALIKTAEDMDNPYTEGFDKGYDLATGYGFVIADKALAITKNKPTIYRYELVNATTQKKYVPSIKLTSSGNTFLGRPLQDGDTIDLSDVEKGALLNIRALAVNGLKNEGFTTFLRYKGPNSEIGGNVDRVEPYSVFGDNNGVFNSWAAKNGEYQLRGSAILGTTGGSVLEDGTYNISFKVFNTGTLDILNLFIDGNRRTPNITEGSIIDLSTIDVNLRNKLNLRAEIVNSVSFFLSPVKQVGEVKFKLSGPQNYSGSDILRTGTSTIGNLSFDVFSDIKGNPIPWNPQPIVGKYKLEVQPFARKGDVSTGGITSVINFEIIDSSKPTVASRNALTDIANNSLLIAPNPSKNGLISIKALSDVNLEKVQIFDSNGNIAFSKTGKLGDSKMDISGLSNGFYIVTATSIEGNTYKSKLIINNN